MKMRNVFQHVATVVLVVFGLFGCSAYMAGNLKLSQKQYDAAISNYQEALAKDPSHWQARRQLGLAYVRTGQYDKAIGELEKVLAQRPGDPDATYYLGLARLSKEDRAKAAEVWKSYKNMEKPLVADAIRRPPKRCG